jgi:hypothetical protein
MIPRLWPRTGLKIHTGGYEKAKRGHATTSAPYAYKVIRVDEHAEYQIVKDEAPRVVKVFELALDGFGNGMIARKVTRGRSQGQAAGRGRRNTSAARSRTGSTRAR